MLNWVIVPTQRNIKLKQNQFEEVTDLSIHLMMYLIGHVPIYLPMYNDFPNGF